MVIYINSLVANRRFLGGESLLAGAGLSCFVFHPPLCKQSACWRTRSSHTGLRAPGCRCGLAPCTAHILCGLTTAASLSSCLRVGEGRSAWETSFLHFFQPHSVLSGAHYGNPVPFPRSPHTSSFVTLLFCHFCLSWVVFLSHSFCVCVCV